MRDKNHPYNRIASLLTTPFVLPLAFIAWEPVGRIWLFVLVAAAWIACALFARNKIAQIERGDPRGIVETDDEQLAIAGILQRFIVHTMVFLVLGVLFAAMRWYALTTTP